MQERLKKTALLLLLMKLSSCYVKWQFIHYQKMEFSFVNSTCTMTRSPGSRLQLSRTLLAAFGFLAPVLGGLIANTFGFARVTRAAALIVWLPAIGILMSFTDTSLMCKSGPAGISIWLALFIIFSLTDPAVLVLLLGCADCREVGDRDARDKLRTMLVMLYYSVAALGELLAILPYLAQIWWSRNVRADWLCLLACLVFTVCAWLARWTGHRRSGGIVWPGFRVVWLSRWCQMAAFMLLFACVVLVGLNGASVGELLRYSGAESSGSQRVQLLYSFVPLLAYSAGTAAACAAVAGLMLGGAGWWLRECLTGEAGRRRRLQAGLALELALQAVYLVRTTAGWHPDGSAGRPGAGAFLYSVLSFGEGTANALSMAAMYELLAASAPSAFRSVALCVAMTTWSLAICLNGGLMLILGQIPQRGYFAHYAIGLGLLLLSAAQLNWQTLPLARRMEAAARCEEEMSEMEEAAPGSDENNSLLPSKNAMATSCVTRLSSLS